MRKLLLLVFLLMFPLALLISEIAPVEYRSMQINAPEQLHLSIRSVSKRWRPFTGGTEITVKAEVIGVVSSETNLAEGDCITISYMHQKLKKGWAGPRPIPILERKTTTEAFLAFDEEQDAYIPAARGASFEPLIALY
ncbi:hypothetical protein [Sphaerochaeta sp. S2]|uniref:hypothetical protein n=1 Tax=Sphaerochaeta sp. S2 TaxID=2798868 RepID=UPI0018E933A3|nr:hypothetical protein [Sphaerochaeta sp. S2]MBJ2355794.1 hypothetical protein [Sphaerochaeta sp. S2]